MYTVSITVSAGWMSCPHMPVTSVSKITSSSIRACKEQSVADHPIMHTPQEDTREPAEPQAVFDQLGLSDQEQKIIGFLRSHRKASERDLRKVLGTRRVAGIVNKLVQKAASRGLSLVEKKGVGEDGEIYEYTGI